MPTVEVILPGGTTMTATLPLHPQLERQVRVGTLKLGGPEPTSPAVGSDGEGDAERVSASPPGDPADEPLVDPSTVQPPAGNASQSDWAAYAVSQGMNPDEAAGMPRERIKARIVATDETIED